MGVHAKGVIVPMVTAFKENGELDEQGLRRLTNHLIEKGVHGLFAAGSTGEGWALSMEEKKRVFEIVIEEANGRAPVYCGTGAITTRAAIHLTKIAEECGANAAVVITPFYIAPTESELYEHYAAIASATKLPVFPYNNPSRTGGVSLTVDVVVRLSKIANMAGIKDSSGDLALIMQFVERTPPEFAVCQGRDDIFYPSFVIGCTAAVAAAANISPDWVLEIYDAFAVGDWERCKQAQRRVALLRRALRLGTFPAVIKEAMSMIGMHLGPTRAPVGALTEENKERLRKILRSVGLL